MPSTPTTSFLFSIAPASLEVHTFTGTIPISAYARCTTFIARVKPYQSFTVATTLYYPVEAEAEAVHAPHRPMEAAPLPSETALRQATVTVDLTTSQKCRLVGSLALSVGVPTIQSFRIAIVKQTSHEEAEIMLC